jgi:hypothetical protein
LYNRSRPIGSHGADIAASAFSPAEPFESWRGKILEKVRDEKTRSLVSERIASLNPTQPDPLDAIPDNFWKEAQANAPTGEAYEEQLAQLFTRLACEDRFVARWLITGASGYRIREAGRYSPEIAKRLKNPRGAEQNDLKLAPCPGGEGLTSHELADLDKIVKNPQTPKHPCHDSP